MRQIIKMLNQIKDKRQKAMKVKAAMLLVIKVVKSRIITTTGPIMSILPNLPKIKACNYPR